MKRSLLAARQLSHQSSQQSSRECLPSLRWRWLCGSKFLLSGTAALGLQMLCVGGLSGLIAGLSGMGAIALTPAAVYAYTTQDLLTVSREAGEDYNALTRRAEAAARSLAQQRFDSDILLTRVMITVLGDNGGQIAPILLLDVNRPDWRSRPDPQVWAKYYRSTPRLIMEDPAPTAQPTPPAVPTPITPTPAEPAEPEAIPPARFPVPVTPIRPAPSGTTAPSSSAEPAEDESAENRNPVNLQDLTLPEGVAVPRSILR